MQQTDRLGQERKGWGVKLSSRAVAGAPSPRALQPPRACPSRPPRATTPLTSDPLTTSDHCARSWCLFISVAVLVGTIAIIQIRTYIRSATRLTAGKTKQLAGTLASDQLATSTPRYMKSCALRSIEFIVKQVSMTSIMMQVVMVPKLTGTW